MYLLNNILHAQNPSETETILNTTRAFTSVDFANYLTNGEKNTDGAIYIRLFEPLLGADENVMRFTTSMHPDHGEVAEGKWWRAVYLQDGVLTLWMADPYRSITSENVLEPIPVVTNALLTDTMGTTNGTLSTTVGVLANYPVAVHNAIARSGSVSSHKSQPTTTFNGITYKNEEPNANHYVWLPSIHEVQNLWGLNLKDKECSGGGYYASTWLRSSYYYATPGRSFSSTGRACPVCQSQGATIWRDLSWSSCTYTQGSLYQIDASQFVHYGTGDTSAFYPIKCTVPYPATFPASSIRPAIHIDLNQLPPIDTSYVGDARISVGVEIG